MFIGSYNIFFLINNIHAFGKNAIDLIAFFSVYPSIIPKLSPYGKKNSPSARKRGKVLSTFENRSKKKSYKTQFIIYIRFWRWEKFELE